MRINDYKMSSEYDKRKWLDSYKIMTGLPYFGGKNFIGKYLINRICNMAVQMDIDGNKPDIFIDVFGGGGKIALSIPEGWFDTIVLNDYNYGITSFFKCCKEQPDELVALIEKLGKVMDKDLFHILSFIRSNDGHGTLEEKYANAKISDNGTEDEEEDEEKRKDREEREGRYSRYKELLFDDKIEPLLSAAATYWVTKLDFMGVTEPLKVSYKASIADKKSGMIGKQNEKERIENAVKTARKLIPEICQRMRKNNIIVERLDFGELVKKYNGKTYKTIDNEKKLHEEYSSKNKLWYMDSPYHPSTLSGGKEAPYEDTFFIKDVSKMTEIIHNDKVEEYGEIDYFIKSDYDPKDTFTFATEEISRYTFEQKKLEDAGINEKQKKQNDKTGVKELTKEAKRLKAIKKYIRTLEKQRDNIAGSSPEFMGKETISFHHFDCLEDNSEYAEGGVKPKEQRIYFKECLGEFQKGVSNKITGEKVVGKEYIWFKGMKSDYVEKVDNDILNELKNVMNRKK